MAVDDIPYQRLCSLVDRLSDDEPLLSSESTRGVTVSHLRRIVMRDIEHLLNTRRTVLPGADDAKPHALSLIDYGLPDLTTFNAKSPADVTRLGRMIEEALRVFEPRLMRVRVEVVGLDENSATMGFRISADLKVDPRPMPVTFDAALATSTHALAVREST